MKKINCWEFKRCGREPGGEKAGESGVCPAATDIRLDGVHGGKNGGRACWIIKVNGPVCGGKTPSLLASKLLNKCLWCDFYKQVLTEEETIHSACELYSIVQGP